MKKKFMLFLIAGILVTSMSLQSVFAQSWNITGNGNANSSSKLGTTNADPLRLFTNNVERLHIDPSGNIGIGTSSPLNVLMVKLSGSTPASSWLAGGSSLPAFLAFGENQATGFNLATAADASGFRPVLNTRRSRGTLASPTIVHNNDFLASFVASGYDGNTFQNPATIDFYVDGSPSSGNVPGRISFVTGSNVGNRLERLKVGSTGNFNFNNDQLFIRQSDGNIGIGTTSPAVKLDVAGGGISANNSSGTGVYGYSGATYGYGVYGNSGYLGVYGYGGSYGVYGGSSAGTGIYGYTSTGTNGMYGSSGASAGRGIYGAGYYGVYGSGTGYGVYGSANSYGVFGYTSDSYGVYGSSGYNGVYGSGTSYGVIGSGATGVYGSGSKYGLYAYSSGGTGLYSSSYGTSGSTSGNGSYAGYFFSDHYRGIYVSSNSTGFYAGYFNGDVYTTGTFTTSDMRLKKNIKDVSNAMDIINQLQPKNYEFRNDGNYATMGLPKGKHYGLLAQDLEKVLPNLVKQEKHEFNDGKDNARVEQLQLAAEGKLQAGTNVAVKTDPVESIDLKAVNYTELIPIMIKAMQESDVANKEKDKQIADLQSQINELKSMMLKDGPASPALLSANGYLKQNIPNPAYNSTIINYFLPDNAARAEIRITDIKGSALKIYNASRGAGQLNIKSGELPSGVYTYTLYVNDKMVDSKQMVITK